MQKINLLIITIFAIALGFLINSSSPDNAYLANTTEEQKYEISNVDYSIGEYKSRISNSLYFNFYSANQYLVDDPFDQQFEQNISSTEYAQANDYYIAGFEFYVNDVATLSSYQYQYIVDAIDKLMSLYATPTEYENIQNNSVEPLTGNGTLTSDLSIKENYKIAFEPVKKSETLDAEQTEQQLIFGTQDITTYTVKEGDNAQLIALDNDIPFQQFANYNGLTDQSLLYPGQTLVVNPVNSPLTVVSDVENLAVENIPYETVYKKDSSMTTGKQEVEQEGVNGSKNVYVSSVYENNTLIEDQNEILYTSIIAEPVDKIIIQGTKAKPKPQTAAEQGSADGDGITTGTLAWPADGGSIICGWYCYPNHQGIDIAHGYTLNVRAADGGVVVSAGYSGDYGNRVFIQHSNGLKTVYAHLSSVYVHSGQQVSKGQVIGIQGQTGRATAVHLHFEVIKNGVKVNPTNYL